MKVCILSTAHDARDDRLYFKEARSLAKVHDVTLYAPLIHNDTPLYDDKVQFKQMGASADKYSRIANVIRALMKIPYRQFDVVQICDIELIPFVPLIRHRTGAKMVCDIWESNYETILGVRDDPGPARRATAFAWRVVERRIADMCDLVLTADSAIADSLGLKTPATVIYNYPLLSALECTEEEKRTTAEKFGARRLVLYHGSMARERGILAAVEMMRHVRDKHRNSALLLVGELPKELDAMVRERVVAFGLEDAVLYTGWVDHADVGRYIAISEIGLVPFDRTKKFEKNIPQKIFEYWNAGLPVIATDLPPIRPFVDKCGGGLLTSSNDPVVLAGAVCELLDHPERASEMGRKGRNMVQEQWRWEKMEAVLLDAYMSLEKE